MLNLNTKNPSLGRVVLIGGSGFIGNNLKKILEENKVLNLSLSSKDVDLTKDEAVNYLNEKLKTGDTVIFLSCITPDKGKDEATLLKNITMASNFIKLSPEINIKSLMYISSDAVFNLDQSPISETSIPAPTDLYGLMHLTREIIFKDFCQKRKIIFSLLRPVAVFGNGDTHNSYGPNRFAHTLEKDNKITLFGTGEDKRDHIYVKDLARIVYLCLEKESCGILNVASGKSVAFIDVAKKIKETLGGPENSIEFIANNSTPTNKYFDNTNLIKAFPSFKFTDFSQAYEM